MGLIYHYTSPEAALSILHGKKLRFTDSEYLNDPAELAYGQELFGAAWSGVCESADVQDILEEESVVFSSDPHSEITLTKSPDKDGVFYGIPLRFYAFCASTEGDSIGLWNGFVKNGAHLGYAIGFDVDVLKAELSKFHDSDRAHQGFGVLADEVIYDQEKQLAIVGDAMCEAKSAGAFDGLVGEDVWRKALAAGELRENLLTAADCWKFFIKHEAFSYEREYRVVLQVSQEFVASISAEKDPNQESETQNVLFSFHHRAGASGLMTPYIEWDFSACADRLVREVRVAPSMEVDLAKRGMEALLRHEGYEGVEVIPSNVQLRF